ncbi:hypothetical protein DKX38_028118 [Salix brachista]|uniref:Uncharacterized protein n=1 Tax=Salix brachista TaxID=2182728 RepID=A0A5N5J5Y5_9ROSI|nr:hypothetical protein DKX38_028118 [Salix brachista]
MVREDFPPGIGIEYGFLSMSTVSKKSALDGKIKVLLRKVLRKRDFKSNNKWILNATTDTRILDNVATTAIVEILITCYQVVVVPDKTEEDEIVK